MEMAPYGAMLLATVSVMLAAVVRGNQLDFPSDARSGRQLAGSYVEPTALLPARGPDAVCPDWLGEYAAFHKANKASPDATYLVQYCTKDSGPCLGIGDRIRGMMFLLRLAHVHRKILLIVWDTPEPIKDYLVPAEIDWSTEGLPADVLEALHGPNESPFDAHITKNLALLSAVIRTNKHADLFQSTKMVRVQYTHWYGTDIAGLPGDRQFIHDYGRNQFGRCFFKFLFNPTQSLVDEATQKLKTLYGKQPHPFIAWHWRIGGLVSEGVLRRSDRHPGKKDLEFTKLRSMISVLPCASRLMEGIGAAKVSEKPMLLVTDHNIIRSWVASGEVRSMVATEALVIHTNSKRLTTEAYHDAWVDMMMLTLADCLVYSSSGYSNVALWMSNTTCTKHFYNCVVEDQPRFIHTPV